MSDHKAKVVISQEVWKLIEWFTYNFDTEIGAYGRVKTKKQDGEKVFYIDKLFFPKQEVSGATVKVLPEGWNDLFKEHGLKGLSDIYFYWHRHPGNSSHSGTDDEHTFETLMSKEANRKYYIFLQTAVGAQGWNHEARIDIRSPIRTTILNAQIEIVVEESPQEKELKKTCDAIAEKCIIKPEPVKSWTSTEYDNYYDGNKKTFSQYSTQQKKTELVLPAGMNVTDAIEDGRYGNIEGTSHFDNDILDTMPTAEEEKVMIDFKDGQAVIKAGKKYAEVLEKVLNNKEGKLFKFVRSWKKNKDKKTKMSEYQLQPVSKKYVEMKTSLIRSYFLFCNALLKQMSKEAHSNETGLKTLEDVGRAEGEYENFKTIEGKKKCKELIDEIEQGCDVIWSDVYNATVHTFEEESVIGNIYLNYEKDKVIISGYDLVWAINGMEAELEEEE